MVEQQYRLTIHLSNGTKIVLISEAIVDEEPEDVAAQLVKELNDGRPQWKDIGHIAVFSGAISAIEVEVI